MKNKWKKVSERVLRTKFGTDTKNKYIFYENKFYFFYKINLTKYFKLFSDSEINYICFNFSGNSQLNLAKVDIFSLHFRYGFKIIFISYTKQCIVSTVLCRLVLC